jgi:hypothetical protein
MVQRSTQSILHQNDNSGFDLLYIRTRHLTLLIFLQTHIKKVLIKFIIPKGLKFKTELLQMQLM